MQAKPGKSVRVGDSYKVVDSSNRKAFVLIGLGAIVVKNGLANLKPIYTRAHEATKHLVTTICDFESSGDHQSHKSIQAQ